MTPATDPILAALRAYLAANEALRLGEVSREDALWDSLAQEMAKQMAIGLVSISQELAQALEATANAGCWCPSPVSTGHTSRCVLASRALLRARLLAILSDLVRGQGSAEELLERTTAALSSLV